MLYSTIVDIVLPGQTKVHLIQCSVSQNFPEDTKTARKVAAGVLGHTSYHDVAEEGQTGIWDSPLSYKNSLVDLRPSLHLLYLTGLL